MGLIWCQCSNNDKNKYHPSARKLIQVSPYKASTQLSTALIKIYDLTNNNYFSFDLSLRILPNISGFSYISCSSTNCLYLCGSNDIEKTSSSFLIKIDLLSRVANILINSEHPHYLPTFLYCSINDSLIVIGGKKEVSCEEYSIKNNFWSILPYLPEERYKASAIEIAHLNTIYLFGGYNSISCSNCSTILTLRLNCFEQWKTIKIENDSCFLLKNSVGLIPSDNDTITILGGRKKDGESNDHLSNEIIDINIFQWKISKNYHVLPNETWFNYPYGLLEKNWLIIVDWKDFVYEIPLKDTRHDNIPLVTVECYDMTEGKDEKATNV